MRGRFFPVKLRQVIGGVTECEAGEHMRAAGCSISACGGTVAKQAQDSFRQRGRICRFDQDPGLAVDDAVGHAADACRNGGALHEQRFDRASQIFAQ